MSKYLSRAQGSSKGRAGGRADLEAVGQAHISAVAGACLSIGIKYAGSADAAAEGVLRHYVLYFLKARLQAPDASSGNPSLMRASICPHLLSLTVTHSLSCSLAR